MVVLVSPVRSANEGNSPSREHFVPFVLDRGEVGEVEGEHLREGKTKGDTSTTNEADGSEDGVRGNDECSQ